MEIRDDGNNINQEGELLDTQTASFEILSTIESKKGISGDITVQPKQIYYGQEEIFDYLVKNTGNMNLENLNIKILVVDPDTEEIVKEFVEPMLSLAIGEERNGSISEVMAVPVKSYIVVLQAEIVGETYPLDSAGFEVIDSTPPETILVPSGSLFVKDTIQYAPMSYYYVLVSTDDLSGVHHIEANIDEAGYDEYTEPILFTTEGPHTIKYKAVDNAQNWEEEKIFTVIADGTTPTTVHNYAKDGVWSNENADIILIATDIGSGVAETYYSSSDEVDDMAGGDTQSGNNFGIDTEGEVAVEFWSIDNVGNEELHKNISVQIDKTPPEIILNSPMEDGTYLTTEAMPLVYEVNDELSGVHQVVVSLDGEDITGAENIITQSGEHRLVITAVDNAGNEASLERRFYVILEADVIIKPESFNKNTGVFTAFVTFPEDCDVATITDAECEGAAAFNIIYNKEENKSILKFRRDEITEDPLDIYFTVTGHFGTGQIFKGVDEIKKIVE